MMNLSVERLSPKARRDALRGKKTSIPAVTLAVLLTSQEASAQTTRPVPKPGYCDIGIHATQSSNTHETPLQVIFQLPGGTLATKLAAEGLIPVGRTDTEFWGQVSRLDIGNTSVLRGAKIVNPRLPDYPLYKDLRCGVLEEVPLVPVTTARGPVSQPGVTPVIPVVETPTPRVEIVTATPTPTERIVTATPVPPTPTERVVTATLPPPTQTPWVVTATPSPVVATATPRPIPTPPSSEINCLWPLAAFAVVGAATFALARRR